MFDDDDDGVEPQFKAVDDYHFEYSRDNPVCFSILPFQFDENDEVQDCDSEKKVYLCGVIDKGLYQVHKKVVAWRLRLDCDQPNILILLSDGNWIRLLKPQKWYKDEIARSIFITVQMIHFVSKQGRDKRNLYGRLRDHLDQVFNKRHTKLAMDDLKKHRSLIKLFLRAEPTLMKSKFLQRLIGDSPKKIKKPNSSRTKVQFIGSDKSCASHNNDDFYRDGGDENNGDYMGDGHAADDDDNDVLCALCDDGGKLLSCIGQCKRSFHPRKKDGRESKCKTLGYTSEELKGIGSYLCKNCKYKQHQCFKCGGLEPSDEPNAKVFKCNNPSCGHFYHPECVAKLLEPDDSDGDENCELAKRIMDGMPFTCPVHWCFECQRMEDRTQRALLFAVCRRCPKSYHRECLPRGISFDTRDKHVKQRAWELSKIIMIYCLDHKICKATGNAKRDHIKFPTIPRISKLRDLRKKKDKLTGKRKRSIVQCSTKSIRISNSLSIEKNGHARKAAADRSFEHMVLKPESPAVSLQVELQIEPSMVGDAGLSMLEAQKGQVKQLAKSSSSVLGPRMPSSTVGGKRGKRRRSRLQKETSSQASRNIAKKCVVQSEGIFDHSVQKDILLEKPPSDNDAELENEICQIAKDKDCNEKEKACEHYSGKGDATIKVTSRENEEQNDVPGKHFVDKHAERNGSNLKSGEKRVMAWGENADGCNSVSMQDGDIYRRENQLCQRPCEHDSRSEEKVARSGSTTSIPGNVGVTPDHVVENPPEKQLIVRHVHRTADKIGPHPDYGCDQDGETLNQGYACQSEPKSSHLKEPDRDVSGDQLSEIRDNKRKATDGNNADLDKNSRCVYIEERRETHYDHSSHQCPLSLKELDYLDCSYGNSGDNSLPCDDENRVTENSECNTRQGTGSSKREDLTRCINENTSNSPMDGNNMKKSTSWTISWKQPPIQYPGSNYQYRYEQQHHVNSSSNDCYNSGQWGSTQSAFPPGFDAGRRNGPLQYPRGPEHGTSGWQSPPFYPRNDGYFTSRWHNPPCYPRRPEHRDHTMNLNNFPNHSAYHAVGNDPVGRHSLQINNNGPYPPRTDTSMYGHGVAYGGYNSEHGGRSNYTFGMRPRTPVAGSVTDRYAPRLERTNSRPMF